MILWLLFRYGCFDIVMIKNKISITLLSCLLLCATSSPLHSISDFSPLVWKIPVRHDFLDNELHMSQIFGLCGFVAIIGYIGYKAYSVAIVYARAKIDKSKNILRLGHSC